MKKHSFVVLLMIAVCFTVLLTSCRKKSPNSEETAALKEIGKQWGAIITAIQNQDIDAFMAFCSENVLKENSRNNIENYLKETFKQMEGKSRTDYEIDSVEFKNDGNEATVKFKSRRKKDFIKENGKWLIKNL